MSLKNLVNNICESRYIVNIGCGDGITQDPLNVFNNDILVIIYASSLV